MMINTGEHEVGEPDDRHGSLRHELRVVKGHPEQGLADAVPRSHEVQHALVVRYQFLIRVRSPLVLGIPQNKGVLFRTDLTTKRI